jgi:PhnB protein
MTLNPHLNFNGNCAAAFRFYEQRLGAKPLFTLTYAASPMADQFPAECGDQIMHATIQIGDITVMGSDSPPGYYKQPAGFCVSLSFDDPAETDRVFAALAENATVSMPLQQTFWALRFGMLTDQFGIPWMFNCSDPAVIR